MYEIYDMIGDIVQDIMGEKDLLSLKAQPSSKVSKGFMLSGFEMETSQQIKKIITIDPVSHDNTPL